MKIDPMAIDAILIALETAPGLGARVDLMHNEALLTGGKFQAPDDVTRLARRPKTKWVLTAHGITSTADTPSEAIVIWRRVAERKAREQETLDQAAETLWSGLPRNDPMLIDAAKVTLAGSQVPSHRLAAKDVLGEK